MKKTSLLFCSAFLLLAACKQKQASKEDILRANIDSTVNPADDFFEYAEGRWLKNNAIPADQTSWGIGQLIQDELYKRVLKINDDAAAKKGATGTEQQIGDFWVAGMDTIAIEKAGITPLKEELERISKVSTPKDVMAEAAHLHMIGVGVFFSGDVAQDSKNSEVMAYNLYQGGLGLPNRDYYFKTDERTVKIRNAYPAYIRRVLTLIGYDTTQTKAKADAIIALETKLAKSSRTLEQLRDPWANYNKMAIGQLGTLSPSIDWPQNLKDLGVHSVDSVIVGQPEFYKALNDVITKEKMETLKDYMALHLVRDNASYLSTPFEDANFDFYTKLIRGQEKLKPRWKRVLDYEEEAIGEALGQLFAKEYFNETAKKRYEDIVENVRSAYKERMEKLDWMSDSTKKKAIHKLATITKKVGYPDRWKDFSALKIDRSSLVGNMMRSAQWWSAYQLNKLGKPVDRTEWDMTPQTYNAYYNPSNNEIVLPAGIFTVPGFMDNELDDALVYGYAAASTVGHEITHGFDDEGRQFDEKGNLTNWWSAQDSIQFDHRAQRLVDQFNKMVPVDTLHIRGKQTLGENLADLGGILIALDAFKKTDTYKNGKSIAGLTPLQRYFLGYALGWMQQTRKEALANQIMTDVHAPAKQRVNGPMPNVPEFYEAFGIKPGDKMYLPDSLRVKLW